MTAVATGPTKMGKDTTTGTTDCPRVLTVTLAGQTSSSWATDVIVKASASIKTDSDGYTMQIDTTSNIDAVKTQAATGDVAYMGGCLTGAGANAKNDAVCFYGRTMDGLNTWAKDNASVQDFLPRHLPIANWVTTAVVTGDTKITVAKWYMTLAGKDCSKIQKLGTIDPVCSTGLALVDTNVLTAKWFQPKEISTKLYVGLPRFSAKETATWTAIATTGKKGNAGCTGKALTGASALVAGAAVAVGAAALAF